MNKETYEALNRNTAGLRKLLFEKYNGRKRLNQDEVWHKATTLRDITQVESWIDEVAKDYQEED